MDLKVCLVTIAIGDHYLGEYTKHYKPTQEAYAKKHGYDFKVITDFLDPNVKDKTTISFNKILVCSQPWSNDYDFIVFVDADVAIYSESPPIHLSIDFGDKIGIVNEFAQPNPQQRAIVNLRYNLGITAAEYYLRAGFHIQTNLLLNTGVLVMQPKKHATFLKNIYDKYILKAINHHRHFQYEQSCIGYELQRNNMFVLLDSKFNTLAFFYIYAYPNLILKNFTKYVYFLHFAGYGISEFDINSLYNNNESN